MDSRRGKHLLISGLLAALVIGLVQHNPFFWDTLSQASRRSSWFFQQSFSTILLPFEIDSGHPTGFNLYLASIWSVFGRSLVISHWAMFPILLGINYQVLQLVVRFFSERNQVWAALLILTDVTLLAQASLVAPDLVLVLGYLLGVRGLLSRHNTLVIIGSMILVSVSLRGLFGLAALGSTALLYHAQTQRAWNWRELFSVVWPFVPAATLIGSFYLWHFLQTGWWFSTPNPAWAGHREVLGIKGIMRNSGIIGWRLLDFGRWIYWLIFALAAWGWWRRGETVKKKELQLILWPVVFLLVLSTAMVLLSNPITHRYLLPALLGLNTLGAYLLLEKGPVGWRKWMYAVVLISQLSGHFWLYPKHIAQAWDGSLAYLPYLELRQDAIAYAREKTIPLEDINTEFPAIGPLDWHELSGEQTGFGSRTEVRPYLFYATVMNDFTDEELRDMETWPIIWQKTYLGHTAIIYQRPH